MKHTFERTVRLALTAVLFTGVLTWSAACRASANPAVPPAQQRGFALPTWQTNGYELGGLPDALREIVDVGGGWVQIVPTWYQQNASDTRIHPTSMGPTDQDVRSAIELAHDAGLKVLLKPHLDTLDGTDRSQIRPADRGAWFASYTAFIDGYATLAGATGAEEFAVGTELAGVSSDRDGWSAVIGTVRTRYDGPIVYAANDDSYTQVAFWDLVDVAGIDVYWPLSTEPTTDVERLRRALAPKRDQVATFAAHVHRPVLFSEAGFTSQRGSTTYPSSSTVSRVPAPDEQAAGYEALLETFDGQPWWAGVFWWVWVDIPQQGDPPPSLDFSVRDKPAEAVLRRWWTRAPTS